MTLEELVDARLKKALADGVTKKFMHDTLEPAARNLLEFCKTIDDVTVENLVDLRDHLVDIYAPQHAKLRWSAVKSILNFGIEINVLPYELKRYMPKVKARLSTLPTISAEDVDKLLDATNSIQRRLALLLAFDAGMRSIEIRSLTSKDVDLDNQIITVHGAKNARDRKVPILTKRLYMALKMAIAHVPAHGRLALDSRADTSLKRPIDIRRLCERAGLDTKVGIHSLRHGFAYRAATGGFDGGPANVEAIRLALGHASIDVTARYLMHMGVNSADSIRKGFGRPELLNVER